MAKKWSKLMRQMSPARRRRIERGVQEDLAEMLLREMRRLSGMSQQQLAQALGISQASVSQMETQNDMQISTLERIVHAMGGQLEIVAKLPTGRVVVSQFRGRGAA